MLTIDGSTGEGGGQVLRTALALSAVTGAAFRIERIRAGRARPGLMRQHATAVEAAAAICGARVSGGEPGSTTLTFEPGPLCGGAHCFAVGTAGSVTLVLQTVLPALIFAPEASSLVLEGGTHNPAAPPFDFLEKVYLPTLRRMGANVVVSLERPGFYPAGGGRIRVEIDPVRTLARLTLMSRGPITTKRVEAVVSGLSKGIAERELATVARVLGWERRDMTLTVMPSARGPGNVVHIEVRSDGASELVTAFGERGVPAETVGERVAAQAARYLAADVPVGEHLADQLLVPMALAGGGSFRTVAPSSHTRTQAELVPLFLPVEVTMRRESDDAWCVEVT